MDNAIMKDSMTLLFSLMFLEAVRDVLVCYVVNNPPLCTSPQRQNDDMLFLLFIPHYYTYPYAADIS